MFTATTQIPSPATPPVTEHTSPRWSHALAYIAMRGWRLQASTLFDDAAEPAYSLLTPDGRVLVWSGAMDSDGNPPCCDAVLAAVDEARWH